MRRHTPVKGMQRGALAKRTGCNLETIRYYEQIGLLPEPPRTDAGYRAYDGTHEQRLGFIRRARELGFTLDQIRELLRLVDERDHPCDGVRDIAADHLADIRAKIADLKRMERVLKGMIVQCASDTQPDCPLIEALFRKGDLKTA